MRINIEKISNGWLLSPVEYGNTEDYQYVAEEEDLPTAIVDILKKAKEYEERVRELRKQELEQARKEFRRSAMSETLGVEGALVKDLTTR